MSTNTDMTTTTVVWEVVEYPTLADAIDLPNTGQVVGYTTDQWHAQSGDWPIQNGHLIARPARVAADSPEHHEAVATATENTRVHEPTVPTVRDIALSVWDLIADGVRARHRARRLR